MIEASGGTLTSRQLAHILVETAALPGRKSGEWISNGAGFSVHPSVCGGKEKKGNRERGKERQRRERGGVREEDERVWLNILFSVGRL